MYVWSKGEYKYTIQTDTMEDLYTPPRIRPEVFMRLSSLSHSDIQKNPSLSSSNLDRFSSRRQKSKDAVMGGNDYHATQNGEGDVIGLAPTHRREGMCQCTAPPS